MIYTLRDFALTAEYKCSMLFSPKRKPRVLHPAIKCIELWIYSIHQQFHKTHCEFPLKAANSRGRPFSVQLYKCVQCQPLTTIRSVKNIPTVFAAFEDSSSCPQKSDNWELICGERDPAHKFTHYAPKINFNIILKSMPKPFTGIERPKDKMLWRTLTL